MDGNAASAGRFGRHIPSEPTPGDRPAARALVVTCLHGCLPAGALESQLETGGLIVARTAANLVPPFGAGDPIEEVIERAVAEAGVKSVIVFGHAGCATLARLFDAGLALEDFALAAWLEHAEAVRRVAYELPPAERLRRAAELNVRQQVAHASSHPAVAAAAALGRLRLHGWLLDPASGEVFAADQSGRFTRRAALDPTQNHLFRKQRLRARAPLSPRDLNSRHLA